jgi:uncharacterized repeat protein (TIGR01451 family)
LTLNNVSVLSNTATNEGGGVYAFGMAQLSNSLFQSNHCTNAGCHGGGLSVYSTLMLTGTRFLNNTAAGLGGGAYVASGLLSGSNRLVNGLFAGNTASEAAALFLIDPASGSGVAVVINTTITSPTLSSGSAIGIGTGTVDITNTIIASYTFGISNTDGTVAEDYNLFFGTIATGTQSIKYGGHSIRADPDFVNPDANNYHLASASAAIDRGVDTGIYDDLDGNPRPQGAGYDIGAYEFGSFVDLSIVKSVTPAAAASGQAITYTLAFSNAGNRTAADVVITDTGSTSWVSNMTYTASIPVTPTEDASISWQAGNFAPAATGIITLTGIFSPTTGGEAKYINVARIGSSDTEIITTNNSSSSEVILRQITVYLPIIMH